jgi:hypothetical protein
MSGIKYSQIELERERKACQETLGQIMTLSAHITALREKTKAMLGQIPDGVKDSFPGEIQQVRLWHAMGLPGYSEKMNSTELDESAGSYRKIDARGRDALSTLIEIKEVKREAKAKELIKSWEALHSELNAINTRLNKWRPGEHDTITKALNRLSPKIEKGDFVDVEDSLGQASRNITRFGSEVATLEAQDSERRYVLEALREVCKEMGWGEEGEPGLEDKDNPASPIFYEVETYSAGKMSFSLTLEGITADSPISSEKGLCYKEFDNLSGKLRRFGVKTKFERVGAPDEEPKLIQRGELDIPDEGIELEMEK